MTIKEIAQQQGMTVQAVYKRIKAAGIDINTLKNPKTGRFTDDGEKVVLSIVESKKPSEAQDSTIKQEVERLRAVNQQLLEKVELLEQSRDDLRNALDAAKQAQEDLRNALNAAQILQRETLAKIPAALPSGEKKGLFSFLHRKDRNK